MTRPASAHWLESVPTSLWTRLWEYREPPPPAAARGEAREQFLDEPRLAQAQWRLDRDGARSVAGRHGIEGRAKVAVVDHYLSGRICCLSCVLDIVGLVASLRAAGGDTTAIEVKSAAGGLPQSLTSSLSALANLPGGGRMILGLDEATGFTPVELADPQALKQAVGSAARNLTPPVGLTIHDADVDGRPVIVADVAECPVGQKPCYVTSTGKAYGRSFDGDFELSDLERQAFLVGRAYPRDDQEPVLGSSVADLDQDLLADWIATVRERNSTGLGRFSDEGELLRRGGVTTTTGELTVAGLLALGSYPQQFFPRYVIQLANALVHRDLAEWSRGFAVEVRHLPDRLVITNAGGLFGISVDRLGTEGVTSARNGRLLTICQYVRSRDDGARVVEALATGIPTVTASLAKAVLPPAQFIDTAIRFTVILRRGTSSTRKPMIRGRSALAVWETIDGEMTVDQIKAGTGLSTANVRRILRDLRDPNFIVVTGGVGRPTTYRRATE